MPLTNADKRQIDEYLSNGQIQNARRMLRESDDPKAARVLAKIDAQYPADARPTPPPFTPPAKLKNITQSAPSAEAMDDMVSIKMAIREKRFDDAEALLVLSDHPDADKLRERLIQIRGVKSAPVPVKMKSSVPAGSKIRRVVILVLLIGVIVAAGMVQSANYWRDYNAAMMQYAIYDICADVYRDDYYEKYSFDQFYAGCNEEADHMIRDYTVTVERCYGTWKDEERKLTECLIDGGAKFSGIWIMTAGS